MCRGRSLLPCHPKGSNSRLFLKSKGRDIATKYRERRNMLAQNISQGLGCLAGFILTQQLLHAVTDCCCCSSRYFAMFPLLPKSVVAVK